jgi:16S rRNA (guanine527-N7)-methyltransferase
MAELLESESLESESPQSESQQSESPQLAAAPASVLPESVPTEAGWPESSLPELLELWQQTLHWQPNAHQQAQFQALYHHILLGNRQVNLTRITAPQEFWEKHLWDSLRGIQPLLHSSPPAPFNVLDIGTGAGFPGIPVAIAQPHWTLTLLDSTRKKINFLNQLIESLPINAQALCDRVEALGQTPRHRAAYDLALIRAVSAASVCAEYALPLVKLGGLAILYRGQWQAAETIALETVLTQLGGKLESIDTFTTPLTLGERTCLHIRKIAPTPTAFPRAIGIPTQKPLGT